MNAKGKCGIVFVDYLGLLRFEGTQPLYQQMSQASGRNPLHSRIDENHTREDGKI